MFHHSGITATKKSRRKTMQEEVTQKTIALVFKSADRRCTEKSHEDVSVTPESRATGNTWENVS